MTKTIAINAGSSSLKWQLYQMPEEKVLAKGLIERIGLKDSISTVKFDGRAEKEITDIENHTVAVKILLDDLIRFDIIKSYDEITGVGHRVVAGGEVFTDSVVVEGDVLAQIEELGLLAPLHTPANVAGIRAFKELLPNVTSVAVLIHLSTQLCLRKLTAIHYQLNITQKIKFVNMVRTELATNSYPKKQQNFWVVQ